MEAHPLKLAALQGGPVRVKWLDSQGDDTWFRKENYASKPLFPIFSWGVLVYYDGVKIVLAAHNSEHWWGNITLIPIAVVLDIRQAFTKATIIQSAVPREPEDGGMTPADKDRAWLKGWLHTRTGEDFLYDHFRGVLEDLIEAKKNEATAD